MEEKKKRVLTVTRGSTIALLSLSAFTAFAPCVNAEESSFEERTWENPIVQQSKVVKGVVVDKSGEPVIGANVVVKGTTNGSITDLDGNFSISDVPANAVLEISYIGYKTQTVEVKGQSSIQVTL